MSKDEKLGTCWLNEVGHGGLHEKSDRCSEWREQPAPGEPRYDRDKVRQLDQQLEQEAQGDNRFVGKPAAQPSAGEKPHADIDHFQVPPEHASREDLLGALQYWVRRAKAAENAAWSVSTNVCPNCHSQDEKMRLYNWAIKPIDRCQHVWHDGAAEPSSPPAPAGGAREWLKEHSAVFTGMDDIEYVAGHMERYAAQVSKSEREARERAEGALLRVSIQKCYCACHSPVSSRPSCVHCQPEYWKDKPDPYCGVTALEIGSLAALKSSQGTKDSGTA